MRHGVSGRKFSLPGDQRTALLKSLVRSLFASPEGRIVTTETRAKEAKPIAEKLITTAKKNDLHARRMVRRFLDANVAQFVMVSGKNDKGKSVQKPGLNPNYILPKLFDEIAPRFRNVNGGYTRITKIGARRGDGAPMVVLELCEGEVKVAPVEAVAETPARGRRGKKA
jgi:large subunit ribosomal protein L17